MIRTSTSLSLSAIILVLAGLAIAALDPGQHVGRKHVEAARFSPDIVATQASPLTVVVELTQADARSLFTGASEPAITVHPESGIEILRAEVLEAQPSGSNRLSLTLDVAGAKAGKWTLTFADGLSRRAGTLTIHQAMGATT